MANGTIIFDEKDWQNVSPEQRDRLIYNTLVSMDRRLKSIEGKRWVNSGCAVFGGVVGGLLWSLGKAIGIK